MGTTLSRTNKHRFPPLASASDLISTGWWGIDDDAHGISLLRRAFDLSHLLRHAGTYGREGETILAEALGGPRPDRHRHKFSYDFYNHTSDREGHGAAADLTKHVRFAKSSRASSA
jgi:hypothetical protein